MNVDIKHISVLNMFARVTSVFLIIFIIGYLESTAQSIASEKCREFGKLYKQTDRNPSESSCNPRTIAGERLAKPGEFPYVAMLKYITTEGGIRYACTAVLISENYLLAPAYCTLTKYGSPISVKLGIFNVSDENLGPYGQEINVLQLKPHPDYSKINRTHVIALIRLEKKVQLSKFVHPICLDETVVTPGEFMASGWNLLRNAKNESEEKYKGQLLKSTFSVYGQDECQGVYKKLRPNIPEEHFCAGLRHHNCTLEAAGIIPIPNKDVPCMDTLIGLNIYGPNPCVKNSLPDMYTKIFPYIQWIESVVWE